MRILAHQEMPRHGWFPKQELPRFCSRASIFVLPLHVGLLPPLSLSRLSDSVLKAAAMLGEQLQVDGDVLFEQIDTLMGAAIADKRQSDKRNSVNIPIKMRPASTSQRSLHQLQGRTKNISITGCGLILNIPPYVGDIYRFENDEEDSCLLNGVLGRCVRCHLIDEEVFEAGFEFLSPLREDLSSESLV